MLIVDVDENSNPVVETKKEETSPTFQSPSFSDTTLGTLGSVHARLQKYALSMAKYYRHPDEMEIDARVWIKIDKILKAKTGDEATTLCREAAHSILTHFLSLWSEKKIPGPATPENIEKQARTAERVAELHISKGNDEAAKKQLDKAKQIRSGLKGKSK